MSLYKRPVKPFKHDESNSDSSDFDFEFISSSSLGQKKNSKNAKINVMKMKQIPTVIEEVILSPEERIRKEAELLTVTRSADSRTSEITVSPEKDDAVAMNARKLLSEVESSKRKLAAANAIEIVDDFVPIKHVLPNVLKRQKVQEVIEIEDEYVYKPEAEVAKLKLKTRLNGVHEWKWKLPSSEPFAKLKEKLQEVYHLPSHIEITLIFDGEKVKDSDTPEQLDMDEDNIIDVKIDKNFFNSAVRALSSSTSKGIQPIADVPKIMLKTRLNGVHEWKWKVPINDAFDKMKQKLREIYNIAAGSDMSLVFDGEKIKDKQTPQEFDMEDDNIIDVKIDKKLYDDAVKVAELRRKTR